MSTPIIPDADRIRVIANYLRGTASRNSRTLLCADVLDDVANCVEAAQHTQHATLHSLPAWLVVETTDA